MRLVVLLAVSLSLSACQASNTRHEDFYTLDTRYLQLCRGTSKKCIELAIIAPGIFMADPIEAAYAQQVTGPNYPLSLARMMLKPADESYEATATDENGRYYRLPSNSKTTIAWDTLNAIHHWIYNVEID